MTVCIGAIFQWNYAKQGGTIPDWGLAAVALSDRMITAGDVQYEPLQSKVAYITPHIMVMVAGDYSMHSQAIRSTIDQTSGVGIRTVENVALIYGRAIQAVKRRYAEDIFLAPLGMNTDTFLAQQREMSSAFVERLTSQLQDYAGAEIEAIVVGADGSNLRLFTVDSHGMIHCWDDVGFAAIGIGAWHAKSRLMQAGFTNSLNFAPALAATYAAKKSSEIAPGVGRGTDVHLIFRSGVERAWPELEPKVAQIYEEYSRSQEALALGAISKLQAFLDVPLKGAPRNEQIEKSGGHAEVDAGPRQDEAQASRADEVREEPKPQD